MSRVPPNDQEAEAVVLGCALQHKDGMEVALEFLRPDMFYRPAHADIFRAMFDLFEAGEAVDLVTVCDALGRSGKLELCGGPAYVAKLTDTIPLVSAVDSHCRIVRDKWMLRGLISHAAEVIERCYGFAGSVADIVDFAEGGVFDLAGGNDSGVEHVSGLVKESLDVIAKRSERGGGVTGVPTGFIDLDRMTTGLQNGDLIFIAARPSMGKTAIAMNIARNASMESEVGVLVFSLEMSGWQLTERVLSEVSMVRGQALRTGIMGESDWVKLTGAAGRLSSAPLFVDSTPSLSILDVRARARRVKSRHGVGLVVIDYLQLMCGTGSRRRDRQEEVSEISRGLKALAKELNVPVLVLSQLSRGPESRVDKRPMLSDLRESGSLEQDADVVAFVYRDEYYNARPDNQGLAELIIGKQRNGPVGPVKLIFDPEYSVFRSAADEPVY